MKIKLPTLSIFLMAASGCSFFSSDPPSCDSNETRELIKEVTNLDEEDFAFKSSICLGIKDGKYSVESTAEKESDCDKVKEYYANKIAYWRAANERWYSEFQEKGEYDKNIEEYSNVMNSIVFIDDLKTTFESYLVKEEKESDDGNSKKCLIRYQLETISEKGNIKSTQTQNLSLTMYKKDDNGDREYSYRFE